ncbi:hypothetical protein NKI59_19515 [Mesorhizobium sp. M0598]|uniref:hypothetical protein n=1 Tax=Mesorhizobium sp. M0598 TaxID=2956968 RepID=UPI00333728C4
MGGIMDGHVEWAVINRLKAMLDDPPPTKFNVTQTFAIFSAVLLWTKNRGWVAGKKARQPLVGEADQAADEFRKALAKELITSEPWSLSRRVPRFELVPQIGTNSRELSVNGDFQDMPVEAFAEWLRNAIGHGDGRTIRPLHKHERPAYKTWLSGFQVFFPETQTSERVLHLCLYDTDMRRIGSLLADRFCEALSRAPTYYMADVATRVIETERVA